MFYKGTEIAEKGIKLPLTPSNQAVVLFITALIAASFTGVKIAVFDLRTVICVFVILSVGISFSLSAASFGVMLGLFCF